MAWKGQAISELSAENGVALVNAYGLTGDKEDHFDDSTTEVC